MKKIIFVFVVLFSLFYKVRAYDVKDTFYYDTQVPNMYITKVKGNNIKNGAPFLLHRSDGTLVYCIEPFSYVDSSTYYGYNSFSDIFGINKSQINRMNLVAKYGYGYSNHKDLKWYGVTQYLIWDALNLDDIYFTDSYNGKKITAYQNEINEINSLVNNYNVLPSFSGRVFVESILTDNYVYDKNNVLKDYDISYDSKDIIVSKNNNYLNIKALKEGIYTITFTKKDNNKNYALYYNANGQNLILPGKVDDVKTTITFYAQKGSVKINKHDSFSDTSSLDIGFNGGIYGIYKTDIDQLVDTCTLDESGYCMIDNLQLTDYYVKEISAPEGYQLSDEKYYISLQTYDKDVSVDVYDSVIKKEISIDKYYGNKITNKYYQEGDAIFNLYDNNDKLINTYRTNSEGNITISLPYGEYILKQIKTKEGYEKTNDIHIKVSDSINKHYVIYDNEILNYGSLEIIKKGDDYKLLDGVVFEIYAAEDIVSKDGTILIKKDQLIDKVKTINGYIKYDKLLYGRYYLKEIKTNDEYELDSQKKYFIINKDIVSMNIINKKIIENNNNLNLNNTNNDGYIVVPNTNKNEIDYLESICVLLLMFGYCIGIYCYKKYINDYK